MQFQKISTVTIKVLNQNTIEEAHNCLIKIILYAAEKTILKTSSESKRIPPVAWWNEECERKERIVRAEYSKHQWDPTNGTQLRSFQRKRAIKQRLFRKARKFVKSLNSRTPTKKVWNKFRKLNGNYKPWIIPPLERGGNTNTSPDEITYTTMQIHQNTFIKNTRKNRKMKI